MNFQHPNILWTLLVLPPALVAFFWWSLKNRQKLITQFIQARLLPTLMVGVSPTRQKIRFACLTAAVALLIVALARPQWGYSLEEMTQRGIDIVVAIDTSKSMLAEDITPNRLERSKLAALDLMQQAKSDRLGLVAFAGSAFLLCPLTIDDTAFRQSVESLRTDTISQGGTALAEAINIALTAFKEGDNHKVLVLFTDGEDNDQGALEAAKTGATLGLRIYTVGVGTADGELLRITDDKGRTDYIRDNQGNVVKSRLNEALLQQIARETDGFYLPLRGAKTIDMLFEKGLAALPKSDNATRVMKRYHEQFHWPLGAAILFLFAEMLLPERKRERKRSSSATRPATAMRAAASVSLLLFSAHILSASPSSAMQEYKAGKYDEALKEYQRMLETKKDDPRLQYNAGAAAYRDQKFDEAVKHFGKTMSAQDIKLQERAYYNLGNTLYRVGEGLQDTDKKIDVWQKALTNYDNTIKLNQQDEDARFNYEFVKRKVDELKKQKEEQQKKQDQDKDQQGKGDKDQKSQGNQPNKDKQDQNKDGQGKNDQQQKQDPKERGQQKDQQGENKSEDQKKDEKGQQQQPKPSQEQSKEDKDKSEQPEEARTGEPTSPHSMTPKEAKQLLDAQKGNEQVLQLPPEKRQSQDRPVKDW